MKIKLFLLVIITFFSTFSLKAQDSLYKWTPVAAVSLNLSQSAFDNWSQGGDNSLAWAFLGTGGLLYFSTDWTFRNVMKLEYGRTKLGGEDYRTNSNEFYLEDVLSRKFGWLVDPYISNTIRTAVAEGYDYKTTPKTQIVDLFDPGYITQSIGFTYDKTQGFRSRIGFAVQEVITNKFTYYSDDTTTAEIEKFKLDTGLESVTEGEATLMDNLLFKSLLRLFSRFESFDVWDIRWDNALIAKVNEYINVNLSVLVVYEKQQSLKTQVKEVLQLGLTYSIF